MITYALIYRNTPHAISGTVVLDTEILPRIGEDIYYKGEGPYLVQRVIHRTKAGVRSIIEVHALLWPNRENL